MSIHRKRRLSRRPGIALALLLAFASLTACASARVNDPNLRSRTALDPQPGVVWIEDFAIPAAMEADADEREVATEVVHAVAKAAVESLRKSGYPAEPAPDVDARSNVQPAVLVTGRFDEIDDGNVLGRVLIGFGLGASHIRSQVAVALDQDGAEQPLFDCRIAANGSRMPGLIVPIGLASEIGLLLNAAFKGVGELTGPLSGDARRTGEKLAERLVELLERLEWSPAPGS